MIAKALSITGHIFRIGFWDVVRLETFGEIRSGWSKRSHCALLYKLTFNPIPGEKRSGMLPHRSRNAKAATAPFELKLAIVPTIFIDIREAPHILIRRNPAQIAGCATCAPPRRKRARSALRKSHQAFPIMPAWSPTHRVYFWNSIFFESSK
jgi:hypothetical protein